jgi:FkbM family methyltransferase
MLRHTILKNMPASPRSSLRRLYYHWQIRTDRFVSPEPEFRDLASYCHEGDWALDIGANVGHYACRLSSLVGPEGHVFAIEPIPETFALLASNVEFFAYRNVTLLNLAASDRTGVTTMSIPAESGLKDLYFSKIAAGGDWPVYGCRIDDIRFEKRISLIKIDVEGHELLVLQGMKSLLETDHPTVIVEGNSDAVNSLFEALSYRREAKSGSPNRVFRYVPVAAP